MTSRLGSFPLLGEFKHVKCPLRVTTSLVIGYGGEVRQSVAMFSIQLLLNGLKLVGNAVHETTVLLRYEALS